MLQAEAEAGEEEEQQEILALPAPEDCPEGMDVEAEMHAAIASAELTPYAKVCACSLHSVSACID